jgi:hypothetical protein
MRSILGSLIFLLALGSAVAAEPTADDRAQVENLMARYIFGMDFREPERYAATFAEDGVLDYASGVLKGRQALADMIRGQIARDAERLKPGQRRTGYRHHVTNLELSVDGDHARARAYWLATDNNEDPGKARLSAFGHYEDELVRVQGRWLLARRVVFNEQMDKRAAKLN